METFNVIVGILGKIYLKNVIESNSIQQNKVEFLLPITTEGRGSLIIDIKRFFRDHLNYTLQKYY